MAKQTVNVGTVADDGTGDTARAAFIKVNSNFDELYAKDAALPINIYVDSVDGDDGNDGLTPSTPLQTLAAAAALAQTPESVIFLKRGSVFRETLDLSSSAPQVIVTAYGKGPRPVLTGSDIVSTFTIHGSGPAYTFTIDLPEGSPTRCYAGVFEDDVRLTEFIVGSGGIADAAAAIAAVEATPGSFYFAGPGTATAGWTAGTKTYYIHPSDSGDPNSNGKVYEAYKRVFVINPYGHPGAKFRGLLIQIGFQHDGFGDDFEDITISRVARHGNLPADPHMVDVVVTDMNKALPGAYFHSNPSSPVPDALYKRCIVAGPAPVDGEAAVNPGYVGTAFYSHGGAGDTRLREVANLIDCEVYNAKTVLSLGIVWKVNAYRLKVRNCESFLSTNQNEVNLYDCDVVCGTGGGDGDRHFNCPAGTTTNIIGGSYDLAAQNGIYYAGLLGDFNIEGVKFVFRPQSYQAATDGIFFNSPTATAVNSLSIRNTRIIAVGDSGFKYLLRAGGFTNLEVHNVLLVNHKDSLSSGPGHDPVCLINGVSTKLSTLDPDARVFAIDGAKCIINGDVGDVRLKYGSYEPGDYVFAAIDKPPGATQPRAFTAVGDVILAGGSTTSNLQIVYTPSKFLNGVTFVPTENRYVAVGNDGLIVRSNSSSYTTYAEVATAYSTTLYAVAANAATVIAVGEGGIILRSADSGATWTEITSPTTRTMRAVTSNGTTFVACGDEGRVIKSTDDGLTWTEATIGADTHYAVKWAANVSLYLLGSDIGAIRSSTDATTWTTRTSGTRNRVVSFAYSTTTGRIIAALYQTSIHTTTFLNSTDGTTWVHDTETLPFEVRAVAGTGASIYIDDVFAAVGEAQSIAWNRTGPWAVQRVRKNDVYDYGKAVAYERAFRARVRA